MSNTSLSREQHAVLLESRVTPCYRIRNVQRITLQSIRHISRYSPYDIFHTLSTTKKSFSSSCFFCLSHRRFVRSHLIMHWSSRRHPIFLTKQKLINHYLDVAHTAYQSKSKNIFSTSRNKIKWSYTVRVFQVAAYESWTIKTRDWNKIIAFQTCDGE